jgi:hypothetical protein
MAGQPIACGGVGAAKDRSNHSVTAGWNGSGAALVLDRAGIQLF